MRRFYAGVLACASLAACAQAQRLVPASQMNVSAPQLAAPPKRAPIVDAEPDVTQQVSAFLGHTGQGMFPTEQLTDKARAAMTSAQTHTTSAALAPCGTLPALELLSRTTKGEDRQYVYRLPCGGHALLVDIDFNKGAKINRLAVRPEQPEQ